MTEEQLQTLKRQLGQANFEHHQTLVDELCSTGTLASILQQLVLPTDAEHLANNITDEHVSRVLDVIQLIADTHKGRQALLSHHCCQLLLNKLWNLSQHSAFAQATTPRDRAARCHPSAAPLRTTGSSASDDDDASSDRCSDGGTDSDADGGTDSDSTDSLTVVTSAFKACLQLLSTLLADPSAAALPPGTLVRGMRLVSPTGGSVQPGEKCEVNPTSGSDEHSGKCEVSGNSVRSEARDLSVTHQGDSKLLQAHKLMQLLRWCMWGGDLQQCDDTTEHCGDTAEQTVCEQPVSVGAKRHRCEAGAVDLGPGPKRMTDSAAGADHHVLNHQLAGYHNGSDQGYTAGQPAWMDTTCLQAATHVALQLSVDVQHYLAAGETTATCSTPATTGTATCAVHHELLPSLFEVLLYPVTMSEFLSRYWQREVLHVTRGARQAVTAVCEQSPATAAPPASVMHQPEPLFPVGSMSHLLNNSFTIPATGADQCAVREVLRDWWDDGKPRVDQPLQHGHDVRLVRAVPPSALPHDQPLQHGNDVRLVRAVPPSALPHDQPLQHGHDVRLVRAVPPSALPHDQERTVGRLEQTGTQEWGQAGQPITHAMCKAAFEQGYTLAMMAVGSRLMPVNQLQSALTLRTLGVSSGTNLYLTPPGAQGLGAHFDDHCVWVVQVAGCKRWLVKPPESSQQLLPLTYAPLNTALPQLDRCDAHVRQFTLRPGDMLYIPRGWAHQAHTFSPEDSSGSDIATQAAGNNSSLEVHTAVSHTDRVRAETAEQAVHIVRAETAEQAVHRMGEDAWWRVPGASLHLTLGAEVEPCMTWHAPLQYAVQAAAGKLHSEGLHMSGDLQALHAAQLVLHCAVVKATCEIPALRAAAPLASRPDLIPYMLPCDVVSPSCVASEPASTQTAHTTSLVLYLQHIMSRVLHHVGLVRTGDEAQQVKVVEELWRESVSLLCACDAGRHGCAPSGEQGTECELTSDEQEHTLPPLPPPTPRCSPESTWLCGYWLDRLCSAPSMLGCVGGDATTQVADSSLDVCAVGQLAGGGTQTLDMARVCAHVASLTSRLQPHDGAVVEDGVQSCDVLLGEGLACAQAHARQLLQTRTLISRALCDLHMPCL